MDSTDSAVTMPPVVDLATWLAVREGLLPREKAHTREGDAIAAARRRLPMTEVDAHTPVVGPSGPVPLIDLFDGREQLLAYKHMWHTGRPIAEQCMGCTASVWDTPEPSYLHRRGVSFVVLCEGPWEEVAPFVEFMGYEFHPWFSVAGLDDPVLGHDFGTILAFLRDGDRVFLTNAVTGRGVEANMTSMRLLDLTVRGRQEEWEDSPEGWPQQPTFWGWTTPDGRPVPQSTRSAASHAAVERERLAPTFLGAWSTGEGATLRALLDAEVTFESPLVSLTGRDAVADAMLTFADAVERIDLIAVHGDERQEVAVYDMIVDGSPVRVSELLDLRDGLIVRDRILFDTASMRAPA